MRALVTGASGFLGGALVRLLVARGADVSVLVRPGSRLAPAVEADVCVLREDLAAAEEPSAHLRAAARETTHIFHCAGCSTDWAAYATYEQGNVTMTARMLALAREAPRLRRFVHVSTTDVYGYPVRAGDEAMPMVDAGLPYNRTKLLADRLVQRAISTERLPGVIVRPSSIYGPGGEAFVTNVAAMLRQRLMLLVAGGRVRGGFIYVDDVCRGMLLAAESECATGGVYNLSSTDGVTWRAYTAAMAGALGLPAPWLHLPFPVAMAAARLSETPQALGLKGRPLLTRHAVYLLGRDQQYGTCRAREELGWQPEVPLARGMTLATQPLRSPAPALLEL